MNWTRVKTILIWLFVAVNIVLVGNIILMYTNTVNISAETINHTVDILKKNGIGINPTIISNRGESMRIYEAVNMVFEPTALANELLGKGYVNDTTGEIYQNGDKILTVKNGKFIFEDNNPNDINFAKEKITMNDVLEYLKKNGFDTSSVLQGEPTKSDGNFEFQFTKHLDGKKIFEAGINVVAVPYKGISRLEGVWLRPTETGGFWGKDSIILRHITGILVDLIRNPDFPKNQNINITAIELGYSVGGGKGNLEHKGLTLIPSYRIFASDGKYYMYDARNGEYFKN